MTGIDRIPPLISITLAAAASSASTSMIEYLTFSESIKRFERRQSPHQSALYIVIIFFLSSRDRETSRGQRLNLGVIQLCGFLIVPQA